MFKGKMDAAYFEQMRRAAKMEQKMHQDLLDAGWVWHDDVRMYLHPDKPGTSISY